MTGLPDREAVAEGFKAAFREHPAGIALITASTPEGPVGLTASSVASVGLDPVALTFSVTRATGSAGALLSADTILVHLLDARHVEIAKQFSFTGGERFTPEQGWETRDGRAAPARSARCAALPRDSSDTGRCLFGGDRRSH